VLVVEGEILKWRDVRIGISSLSYVQVIGGLREGDLIVTGSDPQFVEGMRVAPLLSGASR